MTMLTRLAMIGLSGLARPGISLALVRPCIGSSPVRSRNRGRQRPPPELIKLLQQIKADDHDLLAVSEEDGRFLRLMAASSGATRALEIGGASGYSAIWIGLGLRETGGRLTTIEYDPARAQPRSPTTSGAPASPTS